jgi:hypothetical protein
MVGGNQVKGQVMIVVFGSGLSNRTFSNTLVATLGDQQLRFIFFRVARFPGFFGGPSAAS